MSRVDVSIEAEEWPRTGTRGRSWLQKGKKRYPERGRDQKQKKKTAWLPRPRP